MGKHEDPAPAYPCMMPPAHLRRVLDPHDERRVARRSRVHRALARLAAACVPSAFRRSGLM